MRASYTVEATFIAPFLFLLSVGFVLLILDVRDQICIETSMQCKCEEQAHRWESGNVEEGWLEEWRRDLNDRLWVTELTDVSEVLSASKYILQWKMRRVLLFRRESEGKWKHSIRGIVRQIYEYEIFVEGDD